MQSAGGKRARRLILATVLTAPLLLFLPALGQTTVQQPEGSETLVCYRVAGATRVMGTPNSPVPFASQVALQVELKGDGSDLPEDKTMILAQHVGRAMVLWRSACTHCVGGNATVIYINKRRYLDSRLAQYLRVVDLSKISDAPPPTPTPEEIESWKHKIPVFKVTPAQPNTPPSNTSSSMASPPPPQQNATFPYSIELPMLSQHQTPASILTTYDVLTDTDAAYTKTCSADPQKLPPLLRDVRSALYCHDMNGTTFQAARLTLYALNHFTSCGANRNIIGCSADDLVVELNTRDYTFVSHSDGQVVFGSAGPKVDLLHVIIHEIGHWMGLPHLDTPGNIMADSLDRSRWIDDSDVVALDSQVVTEATRNRGKGAFFYVKEAKKSF
jgi:Matrixin